MYKEGDRLVTGHRLIKFLGRGNFGEVWQASAPGNTFAALKFLNLEQTQGRKEYRAIQPLKNLRHANLLQMTAIWLLDENGEIIPDDQAMEGMLMDTVRGTMQSVTITPNAHRAATLIIAMPYADKSLDKLLQEYQAKGQAGIPRDELFDYMEDAAKAIDYLNTPHHDLGQGPMAIRHCDVKPENLLLMGQSVVLCDFGVSRPMLGSSTARKTTMGGSLAYMAPECLSDEVTEYSDQFSLAISYLELRTGNLPFESSSQAAVMDQRRRGILDLSQLPKAEAQVIHRATSVNPTNRFRSCIEMVNSLRLAIEAKPTSGWGKVLLIGTGSIGLLAAAIVYANPNGWKGAEKGGEDPAEVGSNNGAPPPIPVPPPNRQWEDLENRAYAVADSNWNEAVDLLAQSIDSRPADMPLKYPVATELSKPDVKMIFSQPFIALAADRLVTLDRKADKKLTLTAFDGDQPVAGLTSTLAMDSIGQLGLVDGKVLMVGSINDQFKVGTMFNDDVLPQAWQAISSDGRPQAVHFASSGKNAVLLHWEHKTLTTYDGKSIPLELVELNNDPDDKPLCRLSEEGDWIALQANKSIYLGNPSSGKPLVRVLYPTDGDFANFPIEANIETFSLQTGNEWGYVTLSHKVDFKAQICLLKFRLADPAQHEFINFQAVEKDAYCARLEKQSDKIILLAGYMGEEVMLYPDVEQIPQGALTYTSASAEEDVAICSFALDQAPVDNAPSKWLVWGTTSEDKKLHIQRLEKEDKAICFAFAPFEPNYLFVDDNRLVIACSETGQVARYDFKKVQLHYEAAKKTGKLLSVQPSQPLAKIKS